MNSARVVVCGLLVALLSLGVGCASSRASAGHRQVIEATGEAFIEGTDRDIGVPAVEWESVVEGQGTGLPAADAATPEQKMMTATKAARYTALADLLGKVSGTQVRQESAVRNMQFAGETIEVSRAGVLDGVQVVKSEYDAKTQVATVVVRIGLDKHGKPIPEKLLPITPLSLEARRARAENAASMQALAALREKVGDITVSQQVRVKNLMLSHQSVSVQVEGLLEGAELSKPEWLGPKHCQVRATLRISDGDLARLRGTVGLMN